jgi:hypothetical protein
MKKMLLQNDLSNIAYLEFSDLVIRLFSFRKLIDLISLTDLSNLNLILSTSLRVLNEHILAVESRDVVKQSGSLKR